MPLLIAVGGAVDTTRLVMAKAALQVTADEAVLAGAAAYQSTSASTNAYNTTTNYFNQNYRSSFSAGTYTLGTTTILTAPGVNAYGYSSYNVSITATATIPTTFMALAGVRTMTVTVQATAANPQTQPIITTFAGLGAQAADWNSGFMYAVPIGTNGQPSWGTYPNLSTFFEIGSNCNSGTYNWSSASPCNNQPGAVVSTTQAFPVVTATQPLAFAMLNMTGGAAANTSYTNQYGSKTPNYNIFSTAQFGLGKAPDQITDSSASIYQQMTGWRTGGDAALLSQAGKQGLDLRQCVARRAGVVRWAVGAGVGAGGGAIPSPIVTLTAICTVASGVLGVAERRATVKRSGPT